MADDIVVIGAGGFGRETLDVIEAINAADPRWNVLGVIDDGPAPVQLERLAARGYAHLGALAESRDCIARAAVVVAIGSPSVRGHIVEELDAAGARYATLVHPAAIVGSMTRFGDGVVVCAGAQLSTNLQIARHVHVNPAAVIGHDTVLEEFVSVNPGAIVSGEVRVQSGTLIGAGAVVLQGLTIGTEAVIGASACVTRDVTSGAVVKGVPAR